MKLLSILALGAIFALTSINIYAQKVRLNARMVKRLFFVFLKAAMTSMKKELPYANIISRTMTKTILRK